MTETKAEPKFVLAVDDDPIVLELIASGVAKFPGLALLKAANGQEALSQFDCVGSVAFVFCDLNMPNMDGLQFLRHLGERQFVNPIAIVSGEDRSILTSAALMAERYGLKIEAVLRKPLDPRDVARLLSKTQESQFIEAQAPILERKDLVDALVGHRVVPYFQPKICARTGRIIGAEALARLHHPKYGILPPAAFIGLAEEQKLIEPLTGTVTRQALQKLAEWQTCRPGFEMAVNMSADLLSRSDFPESLVSVCAGYHVDPKHVILELTENRVLDSGGLPLEVLARLRMNKFGLSIDDFGTGYSNIERLRDMPFTELKVDQGFIQNARTDAFAEKCVRASIDLGRALGLQIVAEGVESEDDSSFVGGLDIDQIQGYRYSKPVSAEEFEATFLDPTRKVA
ncbi:MAG: EAL domain-containing response regulator [Pseudomonadota bacterium]